MHEETGGDLINNRQKDWQKTRAVEMDPLGIHTESNHASERVAFAPAKTPDMKPIQ
jgi:hypothetical protein